MTDLSNAIHLCRILRWNRAVAALSTRPTPDGAPLNFISMFSGIEAASVAFGPLDWRPVVFAEIEKFPSAVLAHHYPDTPNVGDMSKHDWSQYRGHVDIVCGGPPCQAFSVAGLRESLDDARGNLSLVYMKALHAIKPRNAIVENVPGWLSTKDNAFGCFLAGLVGAVDALPPPNGRRWPNAGMVAGSKGRAAWRVLDVQFFGLAQRRKRVIVVADFGNGADPAAVLFEPESVRRDSPPSRETGEGVAPTISARTKGGGGLGTDFDLDGGLVQTFDRQSNCEYGEQDLASTVSARDYKSPTDLVAQQVYSIMPQNSGKDYKARPVDVAQPVMAAGQNHGNQGGDVVCVHAIQAGALRTNPNSGPDGVGVQADIAYTLEARAEVQAVSVTGPISHALKAEGADGSEDGTGRGTPIIAFQSNQSFDSGNNIDISPTLRIGSNGQGQPPAITVALRGREGGATAELGGEVATALRASSGGGDKPHVLTSAVRRLTPRECERLQGFQFRVTSTYPGAWQDEVGRWWSPDYTAIPYNKVSEAKLDADWVKYMARGNPKNLIRADVARLAADGPRYKALGNSWAVPLFTWLGERIQRLMPLR